MMPAAFTLRTRLLFESPIYRLPAPSKATLEGEPIAALMAALPSPLWLSEPLPATVLMLRVVASTLRTRKFPESAM